MPPKCRWIPSCPTAGPRLAWLTALFVGLVVTCGLVAESHAAPPAACVVGPPAPPQPPKTPPAPPTPPRQEPNFTLADLGNATGIQKLGVGDFWVTRTAEQRAYVIAEVDRARKDGGQRAVETKLLALAADAIVARRQQEQNNSQDGRYDLLDQRRDLVRLAAAYDKEKADKTKRVMAPPGRELFDLKRGLDPNFDPNTLLGLARPETTAAERKVILAGRVAGVTGIAKRGEAEKPGDDSTGRVLANFGKGVVGRTPIAFAFGDDDLRTTPSPDQVYRRRLLGDAMDVTQDLVFEGNGKGMVVVRRFTDPLILEAVNEILKPGNFEAVDVAAQRAAGQSTPGDKLIAAVDLQTVANGNYPEPLKRAAAVLADPETFAALNKASGLSQPGLATRADFDALKDRHTPAPERYLWSLNPTVTRVWIPQNDQFTVRPPVDDHRMPAGRTSHGEVMEIRRYSPLGEAIAAKETELLTGKITLKQYEDYMLDVAAKEAVAGAADARKKLAEETDRLVAEAEATPSSTLYKRALEKELNRGVNERLYKEYVDRTWYESLGVGGWGLVTEVVSIPIGLGELVVYGSDHLNVVVWKRGRPDRGKLLWELTGEERSAAVDAIGYAFEDWWQSAQAEPDRAIGQTVGFVATFFIPISKLSKVARATDGLTKSLNRADKLLSAGRVAEAEVQLARARRYSDTLAQIAKQKNADRAARSLGEEEKLTKLAGTANETVAKAEAELALMKEYPAWVVERSKAVFRALEASRGTKISAEEKLIILKRQSEIEQLIADLGKPKPGANFLNDPVYKEALAALNEAGVLFSGLNSTVRFAAASDGYATSAHAVLSKVVEAAGGAEKLAALPRAERLAQLTKKFDELYKTGPTDAVARAKFLDDANNLLAVTGPSREVRFRSIERPASQTGPLTEAEAQALVNAKASGGLNSTATTIDHAKLFFPKAQGPLVIFEYPRGAPAVVINGEGTVAKTGIEYRTAMNQNAGAFVPNEMMVGTPPGGWKVESVVFENGIYRVKLKAR